MVGLLWKARQYAAAVRLEQFWNRLLEQSTFSLYCAYPVDIFGKDFDLSTLDSLLGSHTHLLPSQADSTLETALNRAMEEVLGPEAELLRSQIRANFRPSWAIMPAAETVVLWLRTNMPELADRIMKLAREHHRAMAATAISST